MAVLNQKSSTNCDGQVNKGAVDLPMEIISDIFSRLPIESILACKVVCKIWYGITRDPCFIKKFCHSHYRPTRVILKPLPWKDTGDASSHLLLVDIEEHKTRHIPIEKMLVGLRIMSSCNGLLCLALGNKVDPVVVYNPMTKEHAILPSSESKRALCNHKVGLGFDPSSGKYKIVRAYTFANCVITRFEIISLGESSWRELSVPHRILFWAVLVVVFSNGALYWKMMDGTTFSIVEFNLSDEKFRVIPFPDNFSQPQAPLQLMDIGGLLTLVEHYSGQIRLWSLTRSENGGEIFFHSQETYETHVNWGTALFYKVISDSNDDSFILKVVFRTSRNDRCELLTRYFPRRAEYLHLDIPGIPDNFYAMGFIPSLVSPLAASLSSR